MFKHAVRWLGMVSVAVTLAACSSTDDGPQHAALESFEATVEGQVNWRTRVGSGYGQHATNLTPAYADGVIYAADRQGVIKALSAESGQVLWEQHVGEHGGFFGFFAGEPARISGGLTVSDDTLYLGTENGDLYALDLDSGEQRWHSQVPGEVLARPAVANGRVVVHLGSGLVAAYSVDDGSELWSHEEDVSLLSLRGTAEPTIAMGGVLVGTASGKIIVLLEESGELAWEERLATPSGSTDLERMVDVDGKPAITGGTMYVAAYNGELSALDMQQGEFVWRRDYGAWRAPVLSGSRLFIVDQESHLYSLDRFSGSEQWRNGNLYRRSLTEPVRWDDYVISADRFGYLHWFNRRNGELSGRLELNDETPVRSAPIMADDQLIVQDAAGYIYAISQNPLD